LLLIGHICSPYSEKNLEAFSGYDLMLTCSKQFQPRLEKYVPTRLIPHAVEASLVKDLPSESNKKNDIIFIGSLMYKKDFHRNRIRMVEQILQAGLPLRIYGVLEEDPCHVLKMKQAAYLGVKAGEKLGVKAVQKIPLAAKMSLLKEMPRRNPHARKIRAAMQPDILFGRQMLEEISRHRIGFNIHAEAAGDYAANVRMFEVAGSGTLLVSDHKKGIEELYEPGKEILTFKSGEECVEVLQWALDHPDEADRIAAAGQKRTLEEHSVEKRMDRLFEIMSEEYQKTG
jgi:spore maturation protein CgeB